MIKSTFFTSKYIKIIFSATVFVSLLLNSATTIFAQQAQCLIYIVQDYGPFSSDSLFATFNPSTKEVTPLAQGFYPLWNIESLDIHPKTGVIYTIPNSNDLDTTGRLYTVQPYNGQLRYIGDTGIKSRIAALAFDPDGTLWGIRRRVDIFTINLNTAAITTIAPIAGDFEGAAWDNNGRYLYLTADEDTSLYRYDRINKTVSLYDSNAFQTDVESLDFLPDGTLLVGTHKDAAHHLIKYNVDTRTIVETLITDDPNFNDIEGIGWWEECGDLNFGECSISFSPITPMSPNTSKNISININNGNVKEVEYTSTNTSHLYFDPPVSDTRTTTTSPYNVTLYSGSSGSAQINATATTVVGDTCDANVNVEVSGQRPWWQVVNGNVYSGSQTTSGKIKSLVPDGSFFMITNNNNSLGLPIYTTALEVDGSRISQTGWNAGSNLNSRIITYNFDRLFNSIPTATNFNNDSVNETPGAQYFSNNCNSSGRFCWYATSGHLQLREENLQEDKIIVFVNGNLIINENIEFTDGLGNAVFVVSGEIIIDADVEKIEGVYITDGSFVTNPSSKQLVVEGTVFSRDLMSLQRDLGSNSLPSEQFIYRPDVIFNLPRIFTKREIVGWSEVPPNENL